MKLYAVVTVRESTFYREDASSYVSTDPRLVLITEDVEEARQMILNNDLDINEDGYYPYALVESLESGVPYGLGRDGLPSIEWFIWEGDASGSYKPCVCPEKWKHIVTWWG